MQILTLNHEYPPVGGGGGQSCKNIIDELIKRNHEITLITARFKGLPPTEQSKNLKVVRVPSLRKYPFRVGFWGMGVYVLFSILAGLKIIRRWKPQLIHAHFAVPAGCAAYVLNQLTGVPYLLTVHLGDVPGAVPEKTERWFRWVFPFTRAIWKQAAEVVAVSEFTASFAKKSYPIDPKIIPNGIVLNPSDEINSVNDPPVILFAGRFVPQKNLFVFLEILDAIRDFNWHCTMIGDGPLFTPIAQEIKRRGMDERIELPGWISAQEVKKYMQKSDILLMPSLSEGLSMVGMQALAAGLAILATNVGGFCDLVDGNTNGYLAEPDQIQDLKKALRNYLQAPELLLKSRQASLRMAEKFNITHIVDQYECLFSVMLEANENKRSHRSSPPAPAGESSK